MELNGFSVRELAKILSACFSNPNFHDIRVYGQIYSISSLTGNSRFAYADLADREEKDPSKGPILKLCFRKYTTPAVFKLKAGDIIAIKGDLTYYEHGSTVSIWVSELEILQNEEGLALLKRKKTIEKLQKAGYLDDSRKRKLPLYCKKIAILTSKDGAVYHDIIHTLRTDQFPVNTVLYPISVQGEAASKTIILQLNKAQNEDYDCILLGRGGGSKSDLSCFDDEGVCLAIANSQIPVITCIGHDGDISIADMVSDVMAKTPTYAATLIGPKLSEVRQDISSLKEDLKISLLHTFSKEKEKANAYRKLFSSQSPTLKIKDRQKTLKHIKSSFLNEMTLKLKDEERKIVALRQSLKNSLIELVNKKMVDTLNLKKRLDIFDPQCAMKNGYAVIYKSGKKIYSSKSLSEGDEITIAFVDGKKKGVIYEREEREDI